MLPGMEGREDGGSRHTVRIDSKGMVWSSGYPLTRFDPETGKFNDFPEAAHTYSLDFDKDENVWFTNPGTGQIGKVDAKTLKVTQWMPPTLNTYERRIVVDSDGTVWFGEFQKGKIGRFDPKTQAFKEYDFARRIGFFSVRDGHRARPQRLVFVLLSGRDRPARSQDRKNCRVSVSTFGKYHPGILPRFRGTDVVRLAVEQQSWLFLFDGRIRQAGK